MVRSRSAVHVLEEPAITAGPWPLHHSPSPAIRARQHAECREKLAALAAAKLQDATDRITLEVRAGTPAESIVEAAIAYGVDLIVMSAPRLNGLPGLMPGSVVGRLLRTAPCPVLVVGDSGAARVHVRKRVA